MSGLESVISLNRSALEADAAARADEESPPFIETRGLSLAYHGTPVLRDISLPLRRGRITALVGPSGAGKSSFLNCINRLTDLAGGARLSGAIRVGDCDVLDPRTDLIALRRRVGMIFQKPNPFPLSIWNNLAFPLREHGLRDKAELAARIERSLRDVGLWSEVHARLRTPAQALSGGQQQRLCIARALALQPEALLLDEPCSALDPIASGVVEDLIVSLRERYTLLVVTHNLAQARRIADYTALFWLRDGVGVLVEYGATAALFAAPRQAITTAYLNGLRG